MIAEKGFSLLELLCVLVLGMLICSTLIELFFSYKRTHAMIDALATMQENGRFAAYQLRKYVSQAGFCGCSQLSTNLEVLQPALQIYQSREKNWVPDLPSEINLKPIIGSDIIVIHYMEPITTAFIKPVIQQLDTAYLAVDPVFKVGQKVILANCLQAETLTIKSVYRASSANYQCLQFTQPIQSAYALTAEIGLLKTAIFYVGQTTRKNTLNQPIDALYLIDETGKKTELVAGVCGLKVSYYVTKQHNIIAKEPNEIQDWRAIVAVQIDLLLRSKATVLTHPKIYWYHGANVLPHDLRLYKSIRIFIPLNSLNEGIYNVS